MRGLSSAAKNTVSRYSNTTMSAEKPHFGNVSPFRVSPGCNKRLFQRSSHSTVMMSVGGIRQWKIISVVTADTATVDQMDRLLQRQNTRGQTTIIQLSAQTQSSLKDQKEAECTCPCITQLNSSLNIFLIVET